ncbi:MAG: UPF0182 family protein, partial [Candidatus Ancillula sp.]|nr:UPF0182 family protein [Candidatus Ancillula sp.]
MPYGLLGQLIASLLGGAKKKSAQQKATANEDGYVGTKQSNGFSGFSGGNGGSFKFDLRDFAKKPNKPSKKMSKTAKIISIILAILVILVVLFFVSSQIVTSVLWYNSLGYLNVLLVKYFAPIIVFLICFALGFIGVMLSLYLTFKLRPTYSVATLEKSQMEEYKSQLLKHRKGLFVVIALIVAAIFGFSQVGNTQNFMLMFGSNPFNQTDPIFGLDISFYVFMLPGIKSVIGSLTGIAIIMIIVSFLIGLITGQVAFSQKKLKRQPGYRRVYTLSKGLRIQISLYFAVLLILIGIQVFLYRYSLLTEVGSRITGATWTAVNAQIPVLTFVAILFVVLAIIAIVMGVKGGVKPVLYSGGFVVVVIVLAGFVYPAVMQQFRVKPNEQSMEQPYIQNNINATREAYGLDKLDSKIYNATTDTKAGQLKEDTETAASIRLLDPQIVAPTFRQLQQNKQYYNFQDTLAVDKYSWNGKSHDTVIAAREMDLSGNVD